MVAWTQPSSTNHWRFCNIMGGGSASAMIGPACVWQMQKLNMS